MAGSELKQQFLAELRAAVEGYLRAVDAWEAEFQKHYRMPDAPRLSKDLEPFQEHYLAARRKLEQLVPRARQLSRRYQIADPWPGLLHIRLGSRAPQTGAGPVIGSGERAVIVRCLTDLEAALLVGDQPMPQDVPQANSARTGVLRRIVDFFV